MLTKLLSVLAVGILGMTALPTVVKLTGIAAGPLTISQEAYNLIVNEECGGEGYYNRHAIHPEWPGGASGVTVGVGYDCGYNTKAQIASDWAHLGNERIAALQSTAGIKGGSAKIALNRVRHVTISWEEAKITFDKKTVSRFGGMTAAAFPKITDTPDDCEGVMLSIVFNRGSSLAGDSRLEMRQIRDAITNHRWDDGPQYILNMRRLWYGKHLDGLLSRRVKEAALWRRGLDRLKAA